MNALVMVDSSAWIHALRRAGDPEIRSRVGNLLNERTAVWCEMIRLELWCGVRNEAERNVLLRLDKTLPRLPINTAIWNSATEYGSKARSKGITVPAPDLLIFATATAFGATIEHADRHYHFLESLK